MGTAMLAIVAAAISQPVYLGYEQASDRSLATPPPYVTARAMNWAYVEQVGREWTPRVVRGGVIDSAFPWGVPGPAAYGAEERDFRLYYARIGNVVVSASPWIRVHGEGTLARTERARKDWLREQGYTGGTRVFRALRPVSGRNASDAGDWRDEFRNSIQIPVPVRERPRFEVRVEPRGDVRFRLASIDGAHVVTWRGEQVADAQ
ncbi:MAG: hypothetical protein H6811_06735 [Phycisphaeraceae bacterium]|nr:hypothetical protein [Phycisphaeraceae bacterium]